MMEEQAEDQKLIAEGVKFEHYQRRAVELWVGIANASVCPTGWKKC